MHLEENIEKKETDVVRNEMGLKTYKKKKHYGECNRRRKKIIY